MTCLEFIANVINSLAWPATVVGALFFIRAYAPQLITALHRIRYKDFEVEFGESAREVRKKTSEQIPAETAASEYPVEELKARLYETAEASPRAGILEAWLLVETAAIELVQNRGINEFRSH